MDAFTSKIDKLLLSLVGIALILVGIFFQNIEYISIPLAIIGLIVCIVASPILSGKTKKQPDDNPDASEE